MPNNYVLLETIALTQSAASVTFDNLPTSGYTDLKIVVSARSTGASDWVTMAFNGSTTGYSNRHLQGNGSAASSFKQTTYEYAMINNQSGSTANVYSSSEVYIPNYRSSVAKSYSIDTAGEANGTTAYMEMNAQLWNNTAAITSIAFTSLVGSLAVGSTFSLYGIAAYGTTPVLAPKATGGNIVANDGTYWYHAFTSSGYFVPQVGLTADVLQIAGGGGGGYDLGGGGGAGGLLAFASQSLTSGTQYATTIGAGGAGGTSGSVRGTNGVNSQFAALTASVGGGGGGCGSVAGNANTPGLSGGSGGGGARYNGALGGSPTTGQGYAGGNGPTASSLYYSGGGGGGAGAAGQNGTQSAGAGGTGLATVTNWGSLSTALSTTGLGVSGYIAGGGGGAHYNYTAPGGDGGAGGGGNGSRDSSGAYNRDATAGVASTGSGGGAGSNGTWLLGKNGGSGVVIIRYPIA